MSLPPISYKVDRDRLEKEAPAYARLILDADRKDPLANIAWRKWVREAARGDTDLQRTIRELCRRDILFYANTFCYVEEPRDSQQSLTLPFQTYEFQDAFLLDLKNCVGKYHHQTLKSRDTGWSFMVMGIFLTHQFMFSNRKYTIASSQKEMVESTENPDTLMAKFDFNMARMPWWLRGDYDSGNPTHKQLFHRFNPTTKCVVTGAASKGDIGRGGRRAAIFIDEFASWDVKDSYDAFGAAVPQAKSIVLGSTPKGDVGAYRDKWYDEKFGAMKVELKWEDHPRYREGMYSSSDAKLEIIDDDFWGDPNLRIERLVDNQVVHYTRETYPFVLDGKVRSPLYDFCDEDLGNPSLTAQEYDRDFIGSGSPFFDTNLTKKLEAEHAREPVCRLSLEIDFDTGDLLDWKEDADGMLLLWRMPNKGMAWPEDAEFIIGCDVASGSAGYYASNATIEIFDAINGEQVGELASKTIDPSDLACYASALGYWFNTAQIAFEKDGHGLQFLKRIFRKLNYPSLYYPRQAERDGGVKLHRAPGFAPRPETKLDAFKTFDRDQRAGKIIIRSHEFYAEQRQFVHDAQKGVAHRRARILEDREHGRHKHGDRVSGGILAWKCKEEGPVIVKREKPKVARPGTLQYLLNQADAEKNANKPNKYAPSGRSYAERCRY